MQDYGVLLREIESFVSQTVVDRVFAKCRKIGRILTFALDAEDHHDVGAGDRIFDMRTND